MKVLLVNNARGWGGGQEHLKDLAMELRNLGVEVHLTARAGTPSDREFKGLGFPVYTVPAGGGAALVKALPALAAILRRERFDVISVNREHDLPIAVIARRIAFPLGKASKLMASYHIATERKQLFLPEIDAIVCISEHVRTRLLLKNPAAASRIAVIHNGIKVPEPPSPTQWDPHRERRSLAGLAFPVIGMVGDLWKNQKELLEAAAIVAEEFPDLKVVLVGDASGDRFVKPLSEKSRSLGIEKNLVFTGRVPREAMPDIFRDFDLSVSTFRNEGFGLVHVESLAVGTPVVAYNQGGCVDILRGGEAGTLVDGGPAEFAAAVAGLLRDHRRRAEMGAEGYRLVSRKFSVAAMAASYRDFYRHLAGEPGA